MASSPTLTDTSKLCSIAVENTFGPRVSRSCLKGFDFTLFFEEVILTIVPIAIVCLALPIRVWKLHRYPVRVNRSWLYLVKLVGFAIYVVLHLVLLVLWTTGSPTTAATVPTVAVTMIIFVVFICMSHLEHLRSLQPSTTLGLYLGISLLFDVARARTLWWIAGCRAPAAVFSASCAVKAVILVLEATEKRSLLKEPYKTRADEALSGVYNRSLFWWLNRLLYRGFKTILTVDTLTPLDDDLISASNPRSLADRWNKSMC